MKIILALAGAAAFGAAAPSANAIEFLGGTIQTSHLNYTQFSQAGRNAIQGAFQVGITPKFSVQADVNFYDYKAIDQSGNNVTLHGIYNLGHQTSVGAFVGQDSALSTSIHFYGVEGGTTFQNLGLEGFVATGSKSGIDGTLYGVSGHYTVLNKLGLGLSAQRAEFTGSVNLTRVAATADYAITDSLKLYAEYGRLSAHGFGSGIGENYVGFGARFNFGPQNGVSFGKRGLLDFLPGF